MSLRSVRLSRALVATEVSGVCRFCGSGTWLPVRYGESWEAWRSLDVNVCQNARHWEVSLPPWISNSDSWRHVHGGTRGGGVGGY